VFVLAVDLDEQRCEFRQLGDRRGAAVDPRAGTAVGADHATDLARRARIAAAIVFVEFVLAQPGERGGGVVESEFGGQFGAFGAVTDHAAVGAQAGQQAERVHEQRLAGAGFAGNDGEAASEIQFRAADDGEILDGEMSEHGAGL
jgi:hypothetical protein